MTSSPADPPIPLFPTSVGTDEDKERGNAFWHQYGNKLRVYGTVEEMCDLGNVPAVPEAKQSDEGAGRTTIKSKDAVAVMETKAGWLAEWLWSWMPGWKGSR